MNVNFMRVRNNLIRVDDLEFKGDDLLERAVVTFDSNRISILRGRLALADDSEYEVRVNYDEPIGHYNKQELNSLLADYQC